MLLPTEVRPFLLHEDPLVRHLALTYLENAHDQAPATQDDVWAMIDRHGHLEGRIGRPERHHLTWKLHSFAPTKASAERVLEALRAEEDPDVRTHLLTAVATLPLPAVRRLLDDPAIDRRLSREEAAELEEEIRFARSSPAELWGRLDASIEQLDFGPEHFDTQRQRASPHFRRAKRLLRALARHPERAGERALATLGSPAPQSLAERWRYAFAAAFFSHARLPRDMERLLQNLEDDDTYSAEPTTDALVHLGTVEVVAAVEARFGGAGASFHRWAQSILGRIKRPASEGALLRLVRETRNAELRSLLASSLAELCPTDPEALDTLTRMVIEGDYDVTGGLDEAVLAARRIAGWPPPDPAAWKARSDPWRWDPYEVLRRIAEEHDDA